MADRGRPTKFNADLAARIIQLVTVGNYLETAAASCGLSKVTLHEWLKVGARAHPDENGAYKPEEAPFVEFLNAVTKAKADAEVQDIVRIGMAAQGGDWRAAAWKAQHRNPRQWGERVQVEVTRELDSMLEHLEANLEPAVYEQVLEVLGAWSGPSSPGSAKGFEEL